MSDPITTPPDPGKKTFDVGEARVWIMVGLFALTFYVLYLVSGNPKLEDNKLFFALAVAIVSGSFCGAIGYWYGSSKSTTSTTNGPPNNG